MSPCQETTPHCYLDPDLDSLSHRAISIDGVGMDRCKVPTFGGLGRMRPFGPAPFGVALETQNQGEFPGSSEFGDTGSEGLLACNRVFARMRLWSSIAIGA